MIHQIDWTWVSVLFEFFAVDSESIRRFMVKTSFLDVPFSTLLENRYSPLPSFFIRPIMIYYTEPRASIRMSCWLSSLSEKAKLSDQSVHRVDWSSLWAFF